MILGLALALFVAFSQTAFSGEEDFSVTDIKTLLNRIFVPTAVPSSTDKLLQIIRDTDSKSSICFELGKYARDLEDLHSIGTMVSPRTAKTLDPEDRPLFKLENAKLLDSLQTLIVTTPTYCFTQEQYQQEQNRYKARYKSNLFISPGEKAKLRERIFEIVRVQYAIAQSFLDERKTADKDLLDFYKDTLKRGLLNAEEYRLLGEMLDVQQYLPQDKEY